MGFENRACAGLMLGAMALGGCASMQSSRMSAIGGDETPDWRTVATSQDRARLRDWREAFVKGLTAARASGHAGEIAGEGALLQPDAALADPRPPAGSYRCRVIKLGANGAAAADYAAYPAFACRIDDEGDLASFTKTSGSQRPVGMIFDGGRDREIFLGTMMFGDERSALDYGADRDRDMIGAIERIGERRWRLMLPYPRFESVMDVIELVPDALG